MERAMISWNVPNLVTINLMAWLGFLIFALAAQAVAKRKSAPGNSGTPGTAGANQIVDADTGY